MWLFLAFLSAAMLGLYDTAKKQALADNAVLPVLLLNTLLAAVMFLPLIVSAELRLGWFEGTMFDIGTGTAADHAKVVIKSIIVLTSWIFGYYGIKNLPITIVGPINATRPVLVLLGAMVIFGEHLNGWQWAGVILALVSLFMLSRAGKAEGVDFVHNKWILYVALSAVTGAASGLYDRYIVRAMEPLFVQSWYMLYQFLIMGTVLAVLWLPRRKREPRLRWSWSILLITIFLAASDFAYFEALSEEDAMISVVSMIRRSSVVMSFACGALIFRERNLKSKAFDLAFILVGMIFLYIGSK